MVHYAHVYPVARKPHRCNDCGRIIRPGEKYRKGSGMDGSTAWTWRECEHCTWLVHLIPWDDEYGDQDFADWEPYTLAHLRLKAMWLKRWQRRDGSLYPLPTLTTLEDEHGFTRVIDVEATP